MKGPPTSYWGKLERDDTGVVVRWHPLVAHCADVAACAEALLLRTILGRRFAQLGGKVTLDDCDVHRLCVLAALHDIGKFNLGFQRKGDPEPIQTAGHVSEVLGLIDARATERDRLIEAVDAREIASWAQQERALELLVAAIGHHGRPVGCQGHTPVFHIWRSQDSAREPFKGIAELRLATRAWFPLASATGRCDLPACEQFQHAFSGLVMLADWMGSDSHADMFPYADSLEDRMPFARERATRAVDAMCLDPTSGRAQLGTAELGFDTVSTFTPREAQQKTMALPLDERGSLTVLESETGSGKTEASLIRFLRMYQGGLVDGLTFALPTRTAATQLHRRVRDTIARAFPAERGRPAVVLAVPGYLQFDDVSGRRLPDFEVLWNDDSRDRCRYRGWAAEHPKRYLAGAIVVGTIDQVLLSSLRVGHAHLRATALLRHLLVVDEVHASDAYMNRILEEVLRFHLSAGGHAFLMSATLGTDVRRRLEEASQGRTTVGGAHQDVEAAILTPYPAIHYAARGETVQLVAVSAPGLPKTIATSISPIAGCPTDIALRALEAARQGARVLVLRNTVADAVATQHALEELAQAEDESLLFAVAGVRTLHHSRFSRNDRQLLDDEIERRFGKCGSPDGGAVAIATQTVQQSLDLDADIMFTDLAPMDVLLQRFGRVHRHTARNPHRPAGYAQPKVVILTGEEPLAASIRENGEASGPHGVGTVYEDLTILAATLRRLEQESTLRVPEHNRELVEVTTHPAALDRLAAELGSPWPEHRQVVTGRVLAGQAVARLNLVDRNRGFWDYSFKNAGMDELIASRLGESDRTVQFTEPPMGPFGEPVRRLSIPGWLAQSIPADPNLVPEDIAVDGAKAWFDFTFGGTRFGYDRLGLKKV